MPSIPPPIRRACVALLGATVSTAALAQDPGYTYVEVGYVTIDQDAPLDSVDAVTLGGSFAVTPQLHLYAHYLDGESDFDLGFLRGSIDVTQWAVGAGVNVPLANGYDFVGRLAYIDFDAELDGYGGDGNGYGIGAGLRTLRGPWDLEGAVQYVDLEDDAETTLALAARYEFLPRFRLGPTVSLGRNVGFGISLRYLFD